MAITTTTLSGAVGTSDIIINVASATGISAPTFPTGAGFTLLKIDNEMMFVTAVSGTAISVLRGQWGTRSVSHLSSAPVIIGGPNDYPNFIPTQAVTSPVLPDRFSAIGPPLTGATIAPTGGPIHHFTGTTALVTITPTTDTVAGGRITLIFDGSGSGLTWTAAGNIKVAGTVSQFQAVDFFYDPTTTSWYPSTIT